MKAMDRFANWLQKWLGPVGLKLGANKYFGSISIAMQAMIPILIIGSFATLINNFPIPAWTEWLGTHPAVSQVFDLIYTLTMGMLGFWVALMIAHKLSERLEIDTTLTTIVTLVGILIMTPLETTEGGTVIPTTYLGASGMIACVVFGVLLPAFVNRLIKWGVVIKMPAGVPRMVERSFEMLIPAAITWLLCAVLSVVMSFTTFGSVHRVITVLIAQPLSWAGNTYWFVLVAMVWIGLEGFFGIRDETTMGIMFSIMIAGNIENLEAFNSGVSQWLLPNVLTTSFLFALIQPGGGGGTLGLELDMLFFAKSARMKKLAKIELVPAIFNINEPLTYGVPIVYNPIMLIPYLLSTVVCITVSYLAISLGIVPHLTGVEVGWIVPQIVSGILAGGIGIALLQVVNIILVTIIWYPFMKIADRQALEEEAAAALEETEA